MQKTLLVAASAFGLVLGASQLAAAPAANGVAMKSAIETAAPVESVGYYERRYYRPYYRPYRYNY